MFFIPIKVKNYCWNVVFDSAECYIIYPLILLNYSFHHLYFIIETWNGQLFCRLRSYSSILGRKNHSKNQDPQGSSYSENSYERCTSGRHPFGFHLCWMDRFWTNETQYQWRTSINWTIYHFVSLIQNGRLLSLSWYRFNWAF